MTVRSMIAVLLVLVGSSSFGADTAHRAPSQPQLLASVQPGGGLAA